MKLKIEMSGTKENYTTKMPKTQRSKLNFNHPKPETSVRD